MKIKGGYNARFPGQPANEVDTIDVPPTLVLDLERKGIAYTPCVSEGQDVKCGDALGKAEHTGGIICLPAPASGHISSVSPNRIEIQVSAGSPCPDPPVLKPERATAQDIRTRLAEAGLWPSIWSSKQKGMPPLDGSEKPAAIVVTTILAQPFLARGKVTIDQGWADVAAGISFLPRLLVEYGKLHLVLPQSVSDPSITMIHDDLAGHAWVHFETAPLKYPSEHPEVLCRSLREAVPSTIPEGAIWVLNVHDLRAIGACLARGVPLHERLVAIGGPAAANPRHAIARIGTPLSDLLKVSDPAESRVITGGVFTGKMADVSTDSVGYDDSGYFLLPRQTEREFMGFVRPGFDRVSALPCFGSALTRGLDKQLSTGLRGEERPCVACSQCESVCPVGLLPQVLHRYLYRDSIDLAEQAGLARCIQCGLCTFVCPSKIDMQKQFREARDQLEREHAEAAEAAAKREQREEAKKTEKQQKEAWHK